MMLDELFGLKSSLVWSLGDPYDFYQYIQLPTVTNPYTRGPMPLPVRTPSGSRDVWCGQRDGQMLASGIHPHAIWWCVLVWIGLVPFAIPAIFMGLGILVSFLQAFIFALLTMIYIRLAADPLH